jgi:hypothetical protein
MDFLHLQRWLDDGGADIHHPETPPPVMWSPVTLSARLAAERALRALPRRPGGIAAAARVALSDVIARVERRQLTQRAATAQLRDITARLHQHRLVEQSRRRPREWQLLRSATLDAHRRLRHA